MAAAQVAAANDTAVQDVLKLKQAGMTEDLIISFIKGKNVDYALNADDLIKLRDQGLSNAILTAMVESSNDANPASTAPQNVPLNLGNGVLTPGANEAPAIQNAPIAPMAPVIDSPQPASPMVVTQPVVVSQPVVVNQPVYFYNELSPYGSWIHVDNEWCWQPTMVIVNSGWRPYWDGGRWAYTDAGWCWTSDYSWGNIAFHYGRWNMHPRRGWVWYPGHEWAPAWVTWRSGGDHCGWAPLPPHSHFDRASGHYFYRGQRVEASFSFGLSFNHFNFAYTRELGERNRHSFHDEREVRNIYNRTTVINNYTIVKGSGRNEDRIVNRGIEPRQVSERGGKPVETLRLRERSTDANVPAKIDSRDKTVSVYRPAAVTETRMSPAGKPVSNAVSTRSGENRQGNASPQATPAPKRQEQRGGSVPAANPAPVQKFERQPMGQSITPAPTRSPAYSPATQSPARNVAPVAAPAQRSPNIAPAPATRTPAIAPARVVNPGPATTARTPSVAPARANPAPASVAPPKQTEQRSAPLSPRMQSPPSGGQSPANPGIGQRNSGSHDKRERQ
jgi:hypothetical protein